MHKAPALAHRPRTEHALAAGGALVRALSLALALAPAYVLVLVLFLLLLRVLLRFLRNRFPIRPQHHDLIVLRLKPDGDVVDLLPVLRLAMSSASN